MVEPFQQNVIHDMFKQSAKQSAKS